MRMIDADKLYPDCMTKNGTLAISQSQIANAPTVDTTFKEVVAYECGQKSVERPQGKWTQISPAKIYECSECHQVVMTSDIESYLYCHHCGADMRFKGGRE